MVEWESVEQQQQATTDSSAVSTVVNSAIPRRVRGGIEEDADKLKEAEQMATLLKIENDSLKREVRTVAPPPQKDFPPFPRTIYGRLINFPHFIAFRGQIDSGSEYEFEISRL